MSANPADLHLIDDQFTLPITVPRDRIRWKLSNATDLYTEVGLAEGMPVTFSGHGRVTGFSLKPDRKTGKPKLTFTVEALEAEVTPDG